MFRSWDTLFKLVLDYDEMVTVASSKPWLLHDLLLGLWHGNPGDKMMNKTGLLSLILLIS